MLTFTLTATTTTGIRLQLVMARILNHQASLMVISAQLVGTYHMVAVVLALRVAIRLEDSII